MTFGEITDAYKVMNPHFRSDVELVILNKRRWLSLDGQHSKGVDG